MREIAACIILTRIKEKHIGKGQILVIFEWFSVRGQQISDLVWMCRIPFSFSTRNYKKPV